MSSFTNLSLRSSLRLSIHNHSTIQSLIQSLIQSFTQPPHHPCQLHELLCRVCDVRRERRRPHRGDGGECARCPLRVRREREKEVGHKTLFVQPLEMGKHTDGWGYIGMVNAVVALSWCGLWFSGEWEMINGKERSELRQSQQSISDKRRKLFFSINIMLILDCEI